MHFQSATAARRLILTCEHAGRRVPADYRVLFRDAEKVLASHRGWDRGALNLAKVFEQQLAAPLFVSTVTRLLVEPNRSLGHRQLYSEFTAGLSRSAKQVILQRYYYPHRDRTQSCVEEIAGRGYCVVHLSLHTFTPKLNGDERNADVGLLYDPRRVVEKDFCDEWRAAIKDLRPDLLVRRNYPYLGKADGFTSYLRSQFPRDRYAGIELEVNQRWVGKTAVWKQLKLDLAQSLVAVLSFGRNPRRGRSEDARDEI